MSPEARERELFSLQEDAARTRAELDEAGNPMGPMLRLWLARLERDIARLQGEGFA